MKITQVTPGIISIPPNGWGATERVIWEYKNGLERLGNECQIKYLNDVESSDIIHIHVANLAIEAAKKGIPYIFTLHDHHVVLYGKDSEIYKQNLEAMKKSIISFVPAEFLVNYFDECDKVFYLSHGVNTNHFKTNDPYRVEHKLLCIANNGYFHNQSYDRKGFRYAIEAAKELNLPITVAGPENNKNFFDANPDLLEYDKLNIILKNLNDEDILDLYKKHSIFVHPSELEAGHPNLTLLEALSCSLPVVGTYNGTDKLDGLIITNRQTKSIVNGIEEVIKNYNHYVDQTDNTRKKYDWGVICKRLEKMYLAINDINKSYTTDVSKNLYINTFNDKTKNISSTVNDKIEIVCHFINQPFLEIKGNSNKKYIVEFWDDLGNLSYRETIECNMWVKLNREYYTKWTVKVYCENRLIYNYTLDYTDKRVFISLDSKSLGDTIAWFPYVEEFRKKHNCKLVCSTFWNKFFKKTYPHIEFVEPGSMVYDLHGMYVIGCFYDPKKEPVRFNTLPLQQVASNILGLDFKEVKPKIYFSPDKNKRKKKYVTIGYHSTAGLKYWNNPKGWQGLVDYLISEGYDVLSLSLEPCGVKGVIELEDKSIANIMNLMFHSEFFVGISSGLSWLAWSLNKHVVMISNMTNEEHEFQNNVTRIVNKNVCNSCWNEPDLTFDKGDWNWCPFHKGTERQFECTKSITSQMVIEKIKHLIN